METSLVIMSNAAKMLAEANTIQKTKELKDLALTAADWAKRKGMGDETIKYCTSYAFEAERKMGELLKETERNKGAQGLGINQYSKEVQLQTVITPPTLKELKITPRESSEAQFLAGLPEEVFDKVASGKVSVSKARKEQHKKEVKDKIAEVEENIKPIIEVHPGEIWQLGKHRIMCGDAYDQSNLSKLVTHDTIKAMITDPPYGIGYKPDWNKWNGSPTDFSEIIGDDQEFNPAPFLHYPTVVLFGANYFSDRLPLGGWVCWDKRLDETKDDMFGSPFELAWYRSINTTRKAIMIRVLHGGVINADSENGNNEKRFHPTQKPIAVMEQIIDALIREDDIVFDPFSGSGSTLLACENKNRKCLAMEIVPEYVAITLQRWQNKTGIAPQLIGEIV
jgi:DNA modification methylase